jgi:hypothetical protein
VSLIYWWHLLNWWGTRKFEEWRVCLHSDGMWYVEEEHPDYGWVWFPDSASKLRRDAVAWAHRYYARPLRDEGSRKD